MTALNKQKLADIRRAAIAVARDGRTDDEWFYYLQCVHHKNVLAMLDELEAAEKRIAELQIARDKCFLSGLKTGWEYGIADDTEGYNREIDDAQAVIDRAAGIGVKGE
ncbi:TPA: hypothetical protein R4Y11_001845 [Citrobacter freundii]|uniref:hypothetical protein n=1 Tax=Citrobacter freundii complex TaxID=1344959 RepID=UPI0006C8FDF6|nr:MULTISPECIES: hypothetical protein [Citrobacter freundii complex]EJG2168513.1 hypothetical protein [Citrobacter freundii 47N]EKW7336526.1 hypothetical protein [Citrobacter freundii]MCO4109791.1 hypothetical protein [Citrobacter freundii]MDH0219852.1 hypothetical protein [Citrobacter freundii]MDH0231320.1 hypothetical protein [Citrobacter freundii]